MAIENIDTPMYFDPFSGPELELGGVSTPSQREIWASCQLGGADASRSYNESVTLYLEGELNRPAFEQGVQSIIDRHEALRMVFSTDGGQLCILKNKQADISLYDLSAFSEDDKKAGLASYLDAERQFMFDLVNGPLFRFALFQISQIQFAFVLTAHHIVCDGWSLGILMQDLGKFYNAYRDETVPFLKNAPKYTQYAAEQNKGVKSTAHQNSELFWVEQFKGMQVPFDIPTDFKRPRVRTYKSQRDDYQLNPVTATNLKQLSTAQGCSFVTTLVAAFEVLLYHLSGQSTIVLGLPAAGQSATGNYGLAGHCVNLLPLKSELNGDIEFNTYLKKRRNYLLDVFDNQLITFGTLLQKLNLPRDVSRVPLVPIVLNIDTGLDDGVQFEGLSHRLDYNARAFETFEIFLNVSGNGDRLVFEWSYNTQLFKPETIRMMMTDLEKLFEKIIEFPSVKINQIFTEGTERLINNPDMWNDMQVEYPGVPLHQLISQTVLQYPNKAALRSNTAQLNYLQLEQQANRLARLMIDNGVKAGNTVAVCVERSAEMVITLLAILKCGACYLPLDPALPKERLTFMLEDAGASLIVINSVFKGKIGSPVKNLAIEDAFINLPSFAATAPDVQVDQKSTAYVLFTSGSTGKPKCLKIAHYNLVNLLTAMQKQPGINPDDKLLAITTISFDIAALEIFLPLISGAEVVIADQETVKDGRSLIGLAEAAGITLMQATPSSCGMMIDAGWNGNKTLKILCGGEPLSRNLADQLLSCCGSLWNMYGPTETTIWSTVKQVLPDGKPVSIGRPIQNTQVYLLNENLEMVPAGSIGEICIAGDGVATGYHNRPELTAEKFVSNPFSKSTDSKLYRTGDLGKFTGDGEIICLGRIDHQVKIRGHRIELDEIQNQLARLEGIKDAVVIARENKQGEKKIWAYIIVTNKNIPVDKLRMEGWKTALRTVLPDYMVPVEMMSVDFFPLTSNGKIDRNALPEPPAKNEQEVIDFELPKTELEEKIAAIWADLLDIGKISVNDNFFELGGHSLIAVKVMSRIEKEIGTNLPLATLFEYSTIKELARVIMEDKEAVKASYHSLVPIKTHGTKTPLFIVHGAGLNVLLFNFIANKMDPEQPVYALQPKGLDGVEEPLDSIEAIASHYIGEIITVNPNGPYLLAGYSIGGLIAFEMAKQLKATGKEVKMLAMLDAYAEISTKNVPFWTNAINKIGRQFPKFAFIMKSLIRDPKLTIAYQIEISTQRIQDVLKVFGLYEKKESYVNRKINEKLNVAWHNYRITPYDGEIDVFKAKIRAYYLPDMQYMGWKPYAKKGVNIHPIAGDHQYMLLPPHDKEFARVLQNCLDKASGSKVLGRINFK